MFEPVKIEQVKGANRHAPRHVLRIRSKPTEELFPGGYFAHLVRLVRRIYSFRALSPAAEVDAISKQSTISPYLAVVGLAIEFQRHCGFDRHRFGETQEIGGDAVFQWLEVFTFPVGKASLNAAMSLLRAHVSGASDQAQIRVAFAGIDAVLSEGISSPSEQRRGTESGVIQAADRAGYVIRRLHPDVRWYEIGFGANGVRFESSHFEMESSISNRMQLNKRVSNAMLRRAGISVPRQYLARDLDGAKKAIEPLGYPLVTKPIDGHLSLGVTVNIENEAELEAGFHAANAEGAVVIVEQFFPGLLYRLMVIHNRLQSAYVQPSLEVTGDGQRSLLELSQADNNSHLRSEGHRAPYPNMSEKTLGGTTITPFGKMGYTLSSVPPAGQKVRMSYFGTGFVGATSEDVIDRVHPDFHRISRRISEVLNLPLCGLDLLVKDISAPATPENYVVNEANAWPGFIYYYREGAQSKNAVDFMTSLLGPPEGLRVPVVLVVTGEDGSSLAPAIAAAISARGKRVARASREGYAIDDWVLSTGRHDHLSGFDVALADRQADVIVSERRAAEIEEKGLGIDYVDLVVFAPADDAPRDRMQAQAGFLAERARCGTIWYNGQADLAETVAARVLNAETP